MRAAGGCGIVLVVLTRLAAAASLQHLAGSADLHHLVYIGLRQIDEALGCPAASHACFYAFAANIASVAVLPREPARACHAIRRNCNRHGECIKSRDWCILRRNLPAWLLQAFPGRWRTEERPAYLFGRTDLVNPTHIAALHFLPLVKWMEADHVAPGQVLMIWDNLPDAGPGAYGLGLAGPLGETRWLPEMVGPLIFRRIRMGEFGDLRFPYPLDHRATMLPPDTSFQRLAELAKQRCGLAPGAEQRPAVVIAKRRHTRILVNAEELRARLLCNGMEAVVVDFAGTTFESQVQVVHRAAVLVSVHGADCMNLMFLPDRGELVEVLPTHEGYGHRRVLRKGDYFHLAQLLGKRYTEFVSTSVSTIITDAAGQLADWNHVNFVGNVSVDVDLIVPLIKSAVMKACNGNCSCPGGTGALTATAAGTDPGKCQRC